jgi:hypothetical protein
MSSLVKYFAPRILSRLVSCSGDLFTSAIVTLFIGRISIHHLFDPSAFATNRVDTADCDLDVHAGVKGTWVRRTLTCCLVVRSLMVAQPARIMYIPIKVRYSTAIDFIDSVMRKHLN